MKLYCENCLKTIDKGQTYYRQHHGYNVETHEKEHDDYFCSIECMMGYNFIEECHGEN